MYTPAVSPRDLRALDRLSRATGVWTLGHRVAPSRSGRHIRRATCVTPTAPLSLSTRPAGSAGRVMLSRLSSALRPRGVSSSGVGRRRAPRLPAMPNGYEPPMASKHDPRTTYPGYAVLTGAFLAGTGSAVAELSRRRRLPVRFAFGDIMLLGVATYQLSRTISRDRVTAFLREPFAKQAESAGRGEVESEAEGEGLRRAVGELLICPFCMTQWVGAAFLLSLCAAPGPRASPPASSHCVQSPRSPTLPTRPLWPRSTAGRTPRSSLTGVRPKAMADAAAESLEPYRDISGSGRAYDPWVRRCVLLVLGLLVLAALLNRFGQHPVTSNAAAPSATLEVQSPENSARRPYLPGALYDRRARASRQAHADPSSVAGSSRCRSTRSSPTRRGQTRATAASAWPIRLSPRALRASSGSTSRSTRRTLGCTRRT